MRIDEHPGSTEGHHTLQGLTPPTPEEYPPPAPPRRAATSRRPTGSAVLAALLVAVLIAAVNWSFWSWLNQPPVSAGWTGPVGGFAYNGFRLGQSPLPPDPHYPTEQELDEDIAMLSKFSHRLRTYSARDYTTGDTDVVPGIAKKYGMTVTEGAWLSRDLAENDEQIKSLIASMRAYNNVDRVMVGNETLLRGDLTPKQLIGYIDIVKRRSRVPVSTAESWDVWLTGSSEHKKEMHEVARHVDFITVHLLPYWEGVPREAAVGHVIRRYEEMQREYPNRKIVIGEVGWPSGGSRVPIKTLNPLDPITYSTASVKDEAQFIREFLARAKKEGISDYYLMEAIDQPWKRAIEGRTGAYWGIFNSDREPKFLLDGPVVWDPAWPRKATAAFVFAFFPIIAFCIAFARFRFAGRLFFGLVIQAAMTLVVWLVTLPFEFYLNTLDWTMLALLLPALAAMLSILLANAFEFTEVVWQKHWQRHFRPERPSLDAVEPCVSIHLPCHNEPPEMVIQTLASLARMHYRDFEVLVIDNNTKNEDVWKPVQRYVERLEEHLAESFGPNAIRPRFRFFHLADWPGFKAGALNFALRETDPRAEVVGVVDADYVVDPDWLRVLYTHFEAPRVAVVQCPQAHRDWQHNAFQRMANWEYDGFFRIGMHHRNERDAIIQHGTMTLVRKSALVETGGWSEWCICEDAELGLRLMNAGWETRYIDEVLGRGLTPSNFSGYKSQRFRWAFGAMQILKRRWNWLWGRQGKLPVGTPRPPGLTPGQRFHFLTGWFSWFADALHLFFTLASLAWTAGMLLNPENFSLPLDLFVIPVLGFFVLKAYFGPSLYRSRVPCGWRDVIGASIASMALSHAIARGIIAGLVQKKGTFVVTPKSWQSGKKRSAFAWVGAVREEGLMLIAIIIAAIGVMRLMPTQYESLLWIGILATQSIPYASSVACALISAYAPRRTVQLSGSDSTEAAQPFETAALVQASAMQAGAMQAGAMQAEA